LGKCLCTSYESEGNDSLSGLWGGGTVAAVSLAAYQIMFNIRLKDWGKVKKRASYKKD
jgi:hypothetical protein